MSHHTNDQRPTPSLAHHRNHAHKPQQQWARAHFATLRFSLPRRLASRNARCSRRLFLHEDPPFRGPCVRALSSHATLLLIALSVKCHLGRVLDREVCRRRLLEIGSRQADRLRECTVPTNQPVALSESQPYRTVLPIMLFFSSSVVRCGHSSAIL